MRALIVGAALLGCVSGASAQDQRLVIKSGFCLMFGYSPSLGHLTTFGATKYRAVYTEAGDKYVEQCWGTQPYVTGLSRTVHLRPADFPNVYCDTDDGITLDWRETISPRGTAHLICIHRPEGTTTTTSSSTTSTTVQ